MDIQGWFADVLPSWLETQTQFIAVVLITVTVAASIALSGYVYVKTHYDWVIDEIKFILRVSGYVKRIKQMKRADGVYDPATTLERHAKKIPNKNFLLFESGTDTFAQCNAKANQVARSLEEIGITKGQNMAILMKNRPDLLHCFYACLKLAVPLSFLNTNLRSKSLLHCIKECGTKHLVVDEEDDELISAVTEIEQELEAEKVKIYAFGDAGHGYYGITQNYAWQSEDNLSLDLRKDLTEDDVLAYLFTSGTTGLPKAVKITYQRFSMGAAVLYVAGAHSGDIVYSPLPLYHSSSFLLYHSFSLLAGTGFASAEKFSASRFWEDCEKHGATVAQYIGETCRYLLARPLSKGDKRHKVRLMSGNGLRPDIWSQFQNRFNIKSIAEFYGATEGNIFTCNLSGKVGACGRMGPLDSRFNLTRMNCMFLKYDTVNDTVFRDSDGHCEMAPRGEPGLLVREISGDHSFDGYASSQQTEKKILRNVFKDGDSYFDSGDLLTWDDDGYISFVDRVGDTFRWKGENVSTQEVGNMIAELEVVHDCCIYGVAIPGMDGKCGMGAVVLKAGVKPTEDVLKSIYSQCEQFLPSYARPKFIRFMSELHVTGTFKHQKFKLQKEGFDFHTVSDVYVQDIKHGTYVELTSDVYDSTFDGSRKI